MAIETISSLPGSDAAIEHFTLELFSPAPVALRVTRFRGREAVNRLFRFDVHARGDDELTVSRPPVGAACRLRFWFDGLPARTIAGVVESSRTAGRDTSGAPILLVRIAPRMSLLKWRRTSRIFQEMTTQEIVSGLLGRARVSARWMLATPLKKRPYCVQYDETDYDFIRRLCASEGIFFFFEDPTDATMIGADPPQARAVFANEATAYPTIAGVPALRFHPQAEGGTALTQSEDAVRAFAVRERQRSVRMLIRRFDFERPSIPLHDAAGADGSRTPHDREPMSAYIDDALAVYEHAQARERALLDPISARVALEAERVGASTAVGATASRRLIPGHRFRLNDHSVGDVDGDYVVSSLRHAGTAPQWAAPNEGVYEARFAATPASVPLRAARAARRLRQTLESATVVGPPGEEIHTDAFGRVKVQFHWDLKGKFDDSSSAWLRVMQPWAGPGYGVQFLPRIGNEVVVGYIDGDADRPVVVGSLHNGLNAVPYGFPQHKTQSGIVTRSTPHGRGGNELTFDDRVGAELVSLHSNRTMRLSAAGDAELSADENTTIAAGVDRADHVGRDIERSVGRDAADTITGARTTKIGGDDSLGVGGSRNVDVSVNEIVKVGGRTLHLLTGSRTTVVGAGDKVSSNDQLGVSGSYRVSSVGPMILRSEERIKLSCGDSSITLLPDQIILDGPIVQAQALQRISLVQGEPAAATLTLAGSAALGGGTVSVVGGGKPGAPPARLFLDTKAHLDGDQVLLNCGPMGAAGGARLGDEEKTGTVAFFVSRGGIPPQVTSVTLVIATPTGEVVERECPVGGSVQMTGHPGEVFTLVETRIGEHVLFTRTKSTTTGES